MASNPIDLYQENLKRSKVLKSILTNKLKKKFISFKFVEFDKDGHFEELNAIHYKYIMELLNDNKFIKNLLKGINDGIDKDLEKSRVHAKEYLLAINDLLKD